MIDVKVELSDKEAMEYLVQTEKKIANTKKPLAESAGYMVGSIKRNFLQQGRPVKWQKLSPLTIALRKKGKTKGMGAPRILISTGMLMNSISAGEITNDSVQVGTMLGYAPRLQWGGLTKTPEMTIVPKKKSGKWITDKNGNRRKVYPALKFEIFGETFYRRKVHIPSRAAWVVPRPFVIFQVPEDIDRIHRIFDKHVDEAIK